jgi:hypothetical protein
MPDFCTERNVSTLSPPQATLSAVSPWAYHDCIEHKRSRRQPQEKRASSFRKAEDTKEIEYQRREQSMALREKEIALREREIALREQQASLREQEAAFSVKQQNFAFEQQSALAKQLHETSIGVGAQFQDLSQVSNVLLTSLILFFSIPHARMELFLISP